MRSWCEATSASAGASLKVRAKSFDIRMRWSIRDAFGEPGYLGEVSAPAPLRHRASDRSYTTIALLFIGFGVIALASIGAPVLLVGVTLLVLRSYRADPVVFWPPLVGVAGLVLGYVLIAPLQCSAGGGVGPHGGFVGRP